MAGCTSVLGRLRGEEEGRQSYAETACQLDVELYCRFGVFVDGGAVGDCYGFPEVSGVFAGLGGS